MLAGQEAARKGLNADRAVRSVLESAAAMSESKSTSFPTEPVRVVKKEVPAA